jgi:DNA primase
VATLGTATTPFHVAKLLKLADNVVFCFDGDAAGRKAAWRALEVSLPVLADGKVVSFLFLPPEDDPDTYVRRLGKAGFMTALGEAKPLSQFLFAELASQVDMATDEGRARFLAQARPLVAAIEAPALAAMLRRRLGELARLAPEEIDRLIPAKGVERRSTPPPRAPRKGPARPEARLLAMVLHQLELASAVPLEVVSAAGPEVAALRALVTFMQDHPGLNLGQVSAYFEGSEHQPAMTEALQDPLLNQPESPHLDLAAEVTGLVDKLRRDSMDRRRTELMGLVQAGTATSDERAEFDRLLATLATAKSGNQV